MPLSTSPTRPWVAPIAIFTGLSMTLATGAFFAIQAMGYTAMNEAALGWFGLYAAGIVAVGFSIREGRFRALIAGLSPWPPRPGFLALGVLIPLGVLAIAYGVIWGSGIGFLSLNRTGPPLPQFEALALVAAGIAGGAVSGLLPTIVNILGEEIGWRGYLVPTLARRYGVRVAIFASAAGWAIWHIPMVLTDPNPMGGALPWRLLCGLTTIFMLGVILAVLRLASGQIWPAVMAHACHNLWLFGAFESMTVDGHLESAYWRGEQGVIVPLVYTLAAGLSVWIYGRTRERRIPKIPSTINR